MPRIPSSRRAFAVETCAHPRIAVDPWTGSIGLVAGVAFKATMIGSFPILSVFGFVVMFGGVVYAITGPRVTKGRDRSGTEPPGPRQKRAKGAGGSFTSRMEDRFRRRFDE